MNGGAESGTARRPLGPTARRRAQRQARAIQAPEPAGSGTTDRLNSSNMPDWGLALATTPSTISAKARTQVVPGGAVPDTEYSIHVASLGCSRFSSSELDPRSVPRSKVGALENTIPSRVDAEV